MIYALYGKSCSGKTTLARQIADLHELSLRSCGAEIRSFASANSITIEELTIAQHSDIDNASLAWLSEKEEAVIEGRFLNYVLEDLAQEVCLIELIASSNHRFLRLKNKSAETITLEEFEALDRRDDAHVFATYDGRAGLQPRRSIDTSLLGESECLETINRTLQQFRMELD